MQLIIKEYLKELSRNSDNRLFLFYDFYRNPNSALGGSDNKTMEDYYNYGNIKYLVKCEGFFDFLNLCTYDESFMNKLENEGNNNNLLGKIRKLIFDIEEYRNHYFKDLEDEKFRSFFKNIAPIGEYNKKYNVWQLCGLMDYYKRCGWLYEIGMNHEQTLNIRESIISSLKSNNNFMLDVYNEKYVEPLIREDFMIEEIKNGNYQEIDSIFLLNSDGYLFDKIAFKALVCSNKFLDLCDDELLDRDLPFYVINRIMDLVEMSIEFHDLDFSEGYEYLYILLGEKKVGQYNSELAHEILNKFRSKIKDKKVIKLY